jgi:hypothetical protein
MSVGFVEIQHWLLLLQHSVYHQAAHFGISGLPAQKDCQNHSASPPRPPSSSTSAGSQAHASASAGHGVYCLWAKSVIFVSCVGPDAALPPARQSDSPLDSGSAWRYWDFQN